MTEYATYIPWVDFTPTVNAFADVFGRKAGLDPRQPFANSVFISTGAGIIALIVGPLLAILATGLLVQCTLASADQAAFGLITSNSAQTLWGLRWLVLGTIGVALLAMILAISRPVRRRVTMFIPIFPSPMNPSSMAVSFWQNKKL